MFQSPPTSLAASKTWLWRIRALFQLQIRKALVISSRHRTRDDQAPWPKKKPGDFAILDWRFVSSQNSFFFFK
jgi:hypothetical protein